MPDTSKIVLKTFPFSDVVRACELKMLYDENIGVVSRKNRELTVESATWFLRNNHLSKNPFPTQRDNHIKFLRKICQEYLDIANKEHPDATSIKEPTT